MGYLPQKLFTIVSLLMFSQAHAGVCDLAKMKKWSALGANWALGSDANGNPLAIYDLSFQPLIGKVGLGSILPSVNHEELATQLKLQRALTVETASEQAETDQAISRVLASSQKELTTALDTAFRQIPWKNKAQSSEHFTLDDIDLSSVITHSMRRLQLKTIPVRVRR